MFGLFGPVWSCFVLFGHGGPVWPCLVVVSCLVLVGPRSVWSCPALSGPGRSSTVLFSPVSSCSVMFGVRWLCMVLVGVGCSCVVLVGPVWSWPLLRLVTFAALWSWLVLLGMVGIRWSGLSMWVSALLLCGDG